VAFLRAQSAVQQDYRHFPQQIGVFGFQWLFAMKRGENALTGLQTMKRLCWRLSHFGLPSDLRGKRVLGHRRMGWMVQLRMRAARKSLP
jgi:hypothetical protein